MKILSSKDKKEWKEVLEYFDEADVFNMLEYGKAHSIHGDGEPVMFYFSNENVKAVNIAMKRDIAKDRLFESKIEPGKYYDLISPYGYGGFIVEGDYTDSDIVQIESEYTEICEKNNIVTEFMRFNPMNDSSMEFAEYFNASKIGKLVCVNISESEDIWSNLDSTVRNRIRNAEKYGIEVRRGKTEDLISEFEKIYNQRMDSLSASEYYFFDKEFFDYLFEHLDDNLELFYAVYEGKIIAACDILTYKNRLHYHLSASLDEYRKLPSVNLLIWEVMKWGQEKGYEVLNLGGGLGSKEDGLYRFKRGFNRKNVFDFFVGKKIFDKKTYEYLLSLREGVDRDSDFFPLYRANC